MRVAVKKPPVVEVARSQLRDIGFLTVGADRLARLSDWLTALSAMKFGRIMPTWRVRIVRLNSEMLPVTRFYGSAARSAHLEEVSDWLTKIIIGIGLAQFREIGSAVLTIGDRIGGAIDQHGDLGGNVIAIGSMIVGFSTGFLYYYIWARMTLRRSLIRNQVGFETDQPPRRVSPEKPRN
jgi:hypothetical protein